MAFLVSALRRDFVRYCNAKLAESGVTQGLYFFLLYIGKHPGCTQKELAGALQMDAGHTTRSIAHLKADGFVDQQHNPHDRRARALRLTPKGEEIFSLCHKLFDAWDEQALHALSSEERKQLTTLLNKLLLSL